MSKSKNYLTSIFYEFVMGGHLTALGASGIVLTIILILNFKISFVPVLIAYLLSQVVYSYNHFKEASLDIQTNPERARHIQSKLPKSRKILFMYSFFLFITLLLGNIQTAFITAFILLGGIMYTEYFKGNTNRYFTGFKSVYISTFWSLLVFLVPLYYQNEISFGILLIAGFLFMKGIVNSTFFDIKDISSDSKQGVRTIPVLIGKNKTILLLQGLNLLSVIPLIIAVQFNLLPDEVLLLIFAIAYSLCYLLIAKFLNEKNIRNLSYIVVDAECIFWPLLVYIGKLVT